MKKQTILFFLLGMMLLTSCNNSNSTGSAESQASEDQLPGGGQENVKDDDSEKDVVKVAIASKEHSTLVAAIKQAELVTSLSNAGPFTVFAPTNNAFNKLPPGTVEGLMQPEQKESLQNILQYHVTVSAIKAENLVDGQVLGMVNGDNMTVSVKDGKVLLNNTAVIVASVPASNGIIHVIDAVLLPPGIKK